MAPVHPVEFAWTETAGCLVDELPEVIVLPREEFLRFARATFWSGANQMAQFAVLLENKNPHETLRLNAWAETAAMIARQDLGTWEQMQNTIRAHSGQGTKQ